MAHVQMHSWVGRFCFILPIAVTFPLSWHKKHQGLPWQHTPSTIGSSSNSIANVAAGWDCIQDPTHTSCQNRAWGGHWKRGREMDQSQFKPQNPSGSMCKLMRVVQLLWTLVIPSCHIVYGYLWSTNFSQMAVSLKIISPSPLELSWPQR